MTENEIGTIVVKSAIALHRELGPGLLESLYESVLVRELEERGLKVERQVPVPIRYKEIVLDEGWQCEMRERTQKIASSASRRETNHEDQIPTGD